jgi:hypothetical protein
MVDRKYPEAFRFYQKMSFIYQCERCGDHFPIWYVDDAEWMKGKFGKIAIVCKKCFEKRVPSPRYYDFEKYSRFVLEHRAGMTEKELEDGLQLIEEVWNMPTESEAMYLDAPPKWVHATGEKTGTANSRIPNSIIQTRRGFSLLPSIAG